MNPTAYMPFYGDDFYRAVESYGRDISDAYLRALWHYWTHEHCEGLRDDSEALRRICRCSAEEWTSIKEVVFDNRKFFTLGEDGMWHQKRCQIEWVKAKALYDAAVRGGNSRAKSLSSTQRSKIASLGGKARHKHE